MKKCSFSSKKGRDFVTLAPGIQFGTLWAFNSGHQCLGLVTNSALLRHKLGPALVVVVPHGARLARSEQWRLYNASSSKLQLSSVSVYEGFNFFLMDSFTVVFLL